jgi:hypothetical protein
VLSRIESAEIIFEGTTYAFASDRTFKCDPPNAFEKLRANVAKALKPKKESEKTTTVNQDDE